MHLVPDEQFAAIPLRKTANETVAVLLRSFDEITGHADVQRPVAGAGHDVNVAVLHKGKTTGLSQKLQLGSWAPAFAGALR